MQRIVLVALDHPYANIVISIMEGRLATATAELDVAMESAAVNASLQAGDVDLEALGASPQAAASGGGGPPLSLPPASPSRDDAAEWRYHHYGALETHDGGPAAAVGMAQAGTYILAPGPASPSIDDLRVSSKDRDTAMAPDLVASSAIASGTGHGTPRLQLQ